jgi:putative ABC transport system permease protein
MGDVEVHALRDVDLDIYEGEFVVLLGPSGSGKSTLLNILGGLDSPTGGAAMWRDHNLVGADDTALTRYRREHVGFVFQFYNLIPSLTVIENVALVAEIAANPHDPREALALVGLSNRLDHFPSQLLGGEQQREVDRMLERAKEVTRSGVGAIARRDQPSHRFLDDELMQQRVMSITIPYIFFGVAAFLLNVALGRLVVAQREQIASLKALGFSTRPIVMHYLKFVSIITALGSALGIAGGAAFGHGMIASYREFFRFPELNVELALWSIAAGAGISFLAGTLGVLTALRGVITLAPAVAMRPPAPRRFRQAWVERLISHRLCTPRRVMILRNLAGRPFRALLTVAGVAFAVPLVVLGLFWRDAIDHMMNVQFTLIERGNVAVTFPRPLDVHVLQSLLHEQGVMLAEGQRYVPVRLRAGQRSYLTSVIGLTPGTELRRPRNVFLRPIDIPADGITLARPLADRLQVSPGDTITIEVMEGRRRKRDLVVAATIEEILGMSAYMDIGALNRLTGEANVVSAAALYVDPASISTLGKRFKDLPAIETATMKSSAISSFVDKIARLLLVSAAVLTGFAAIIAVGVVYNGARVGLQERAWELASLRVLGFTRSEVSRILLGEFVMELFLGVPLCLALSKFIVDLIARFHSNETFQVPAVIASRTFAAAALVVVLAAAGSALLVRRRIDRLDLVAVLKTRV